MVANFWLIYNLFFSKVGPLNVTEKKYSKILIDVLEQNNYEVKMGGSWSPNNCQARHKVI